METLQHIISNLPLYISAAIGLLSGVIGVALLIPGAEPERTLKKIVALLEKVSKK